MRNALAVSLLLLAGAAAAEEVGSVAAVNRDVDSFQPGAATRSLLLGDRVITDERLESSAIGSGQILFIDQTSLTVAPNSTITLDKYVYDPASERGEIGLTVARGALRMIGGRITKTADASVATPTATIGIRGGISLISVDGENTRVMHVAGEYTRVAGRGGGAPLHLTRPNALAQIGPGGDPQYLGVATEADVAAIYNSMQGGGGGREEPVETEAVEGSGVAGATSENPATLHEPPISTAGERPAEDNVVEVEQETAPSTPSVQQQTEEQAGGGETPTPPEPPAPNPFAAFIGGGIFASDQPFTDDDGNTAPNPSAVNFVASGEGPIATAITPGSVRIDFEDGSFAVLPLKEDGGFFDVAAADTQTSEGRLRGRGFFDPNAGLFLYNLKNRQGEIGAIFGAEPGPTQLAQVNANGANFRVLGFTVLPDLGISSTLTPQPFLPAGVGERFAASGPATLFFVSRPNTPLFGQGAGSASGLGNRFMLPQFAITGSGATQSFLLSVAASGILNSGAGSPSLASFGRGSFRIGAAGPANRIQPHFGTISVSPDDNPGATVFGKGDNYLLLSNTSQFGLDDDVEEETVASTIQNIGGGLFDAYGNLHLAQRTSNNTIAPSDRITIGSNAAAFAQETGLTGGSEGRFLSFGYSAATGAFRDASGAVDTIGMRTASVSLVSAAANFSQDRPTASVVIDMDETVDDNNILFFGGARLAFGGGRSAVIDKDRFGLRDHPNPESLENVLTFSGLPANRIGTSEFGELSGRPDDSFGQTAFRGAMIGSGFADVAALYPANTLLKPLFLTWGWWTGQFRFADNDPGEFQGARLQFSLGTWVAGDRTDVLPTNGVATYNGPVTVHAITPTGDFVDGGRFRLTFDFSSRTGTAGFQNVLDLADFTVPVDDQTSRQGLNDYGGSATVGLANAPTNVRVDGSFFDGPNQNDARATAGSLRLDNTSASITATGTFWGER